MNFIAIHSSKWKCKTSNTCSSNFKLKGKLSRTKFLLIMSATNRSAWNYRIMTKSKTRTKAKLSYKVRVSNKFQINS